ncbi:MAG: NAD(P)H-dependent oxidoreductase [Syntrophobacteraceae bacterium]
MNCLIVTAHPLVDSLCATLAARASSALRARGHRVTVEDLYANGFEASLGPEERQSYYGRPYDSQAVAGEAQRLLAAEGIVLVFPTWWFGFPAILKGWFDRVWAPGIAYDHADDFGPIRPRLLGLRRMLAVTSLGSPWWVDRVVLRMPVKRVLKTAILRACAPKCAFEMLSFYKSERLSVREVQAFSERVAAALDRWQ